MIAGVLLVNKPINWTSFDAVNYIRKIISSNYNLKPKNIKVGHSGTLDPLATGLLIILIGKEYTSRASEFIKNDKIYDVSLKLGYRSDSYDLETNLIQVSNYIPTNDQMNKTINMHVGKISQLPPIYSAKKIDGKRLYEFARKNQKPIIKPQQIEIYWIKKIKYQYPYLEFSVKVSSGTYIRSLVSDIGKTLKTGAVMTKLERTRIGEYSLKDSVDIEGLNFEIISENLLT